MPHDPENTPEADPGPAAPSPGLSDAPLTRREREILGLLAEGLSGAQIAEKLVLSPETVRTHVRNAMAKLGASTRSQAVALALRRQEISGDQPDVAVEPAQPAREVPVRDRPAALAAMLDGLVSLYDVHGGGVYLADEDGLSLRLVAGSRPDPEPEFPSAVALGDGPLGRAALERRSQLIRDPDTASPGGGALIATPILGGGRLVGLIALSARISRPVGRSELLLLQAFATRVGEILLAGGDVDRRLERAMEGFQASWSATTRLT